MIIAIYLIIHRENDQGIGIIELINKTLHPSKEKKKKFILKKEKFQNLGSFFKFLV